MRWSRRIQSFPLENWLEAGSQRVPTPIWKNEERGTLVRFGYGSKECIIMAGHGRCGNRIIEATVTICEGILRQNVRRGYSDRTWGYSYRVWGL